MKKRYCSTSGILGILLGIIMLTSCSSPKKVAYFQDINDVVLTRYVDPVQIKVEPGDKLSIIIKTKDKALSDLFNLTVVSSHLGQRTGSNNGITSRTYMTENEGVSDYTVTPEGTIDFPVLGTLKIAGMTRSELSGFIKGELMGRKLVSDPPVVTVEFLSAGFSVMGEVNRPGKYNINLDEINILDALSMAGDLTIQGQRDNVAVVRREADGIHKYRVDLTNLEEMVNSPAYYLKQGDVVYVEPNNVRKRQTTVNGNNVLSTSFWVSVASLLTSIAVLIFK